MIRAVAFLAAAFLVPCATVAQEAEKKSGRDVVVLPVIAHTPETRLALGAASILFFRSPVSTRPSTVSAFFMYTQNEQILATLGSEVYTRDEQHKLEASIGFIEFPDRFYGIGADTPESNEEDYTPRSFNVMAGVQQRWRAHWHAGVRYEFSTWDVIETEPDGALAGGDITGSNGGTTSGAGLLFNRDTRDNVYYASRGSFYQLAATTYPGWLGSDFDYARFTLDLRRYSRFGNRHVIALQALTVATNGDTPFQSLAALGGSEIMRGYYQGRYRDRYAAVLQSEYRVKVWWRLGATVFGSVGDVAHSPGDFELDHFRYSAGVGIRFLISRQEGMNLRLDSAFGEDTSGFYITVGEAF
jgi:outer membrane protein assembly factor BamA